MVSISILHAVSGCLHGCDLDLLIVVLRFNQVRNLVKTPSTLTGQDDGAINHEAVHWHVQMKEAMKEAP